MKRLWTIATISVVLSLAGCAKFYGLKQPKTRSDETIQKFAARYEIPSGKSFLLDTSFLTFARNLDTAQKELIKNHLQPLQALYFDKSGRLVSYHINCYAVGFPNLKWNKDGLFDTFPPKKQAPVDSLLDFNRQLQFIRTFNNKTLAPSAFAKADYNVVVYWSVFMGRQSKRFIKLIEDNGELANGKSVNFLFVNSDYLFVTENVSD